jgi:hypothetical protein
MYIEEKDRFLQMVPITRNIDASRWSKRGWTFQEALLSKRRLYFTEQQVYFETQHHVTSELFWSASPQLRISASHTGIHSQGVWVSAPHHIYGCIRAFTWRYLSHPGDTLNAMLGIFALYQHKFSIRHLWGTPFSAHTPASTPQGSHTEAIIFEKKSAMVLGWE